MRGAVLSGYVVQLDVNVLGAAEHTAQAWEAAVAARSERTSQQHLALVAVERVVCDAGWRL